jgi:5-(carboxyamino)imidazole ribonucleotide mutase
VATVAIGAWGMRNAALLAAQILAVADEDLRRRLSQEKARLAEAAEGQAAAVRRGEEERR